jgi:hypothetical protein
MKIGEVGDSKVLEMLLKALGAGKATNAKPPRAVVPRISLAQQLLSKLAESIDSGAATHG